MFFLLSSLFNLNCFSGEVLHHSTNILFSGFSFKYVVILENFLFPSVKRHLQATAKHHLQPFHSDF